MAMNLRERKKCNRSSPEKFADVHCEGIIPGDKSREEKKTKQRQTETESTVVALAGGLVLTGILQWRECIRGV